MSQSRDKITTWRAILDKLTPVKSFKIPVSDGHVLHVEESGKANGKAVLVLHGGPGAGIGSAYRAMFEATPFRVIAFDQRGCGKSKPFGSIEHNTTNDLIDDIETLRIHFKIDSWLVFGGSWGSTLALAYAIAHPKRVSGLILRGIFLGRKQDTQWFVSDSEGASQVFSSEYQAFAQGYDSNSNQDLCKYYFDLLTDKNEEVRQQAAARWFNWEGSISKLKKFDGEMSNYASTQQIYALALLECYYLMHNCFMPNNHILENCYRIAHIPLHIVHGRYDMVCKCKAAIELHKALPQSSLKIIENAGHSMSEPGINRALVDALKTFK